MTPGRRHESHQCAAHRRSRLLHPFRRICRSRSSTRGRGGVPRPAVPKSFPGRTGRAARETGDSGSDELRQPPPANCIFSAVKRTGGILGPIGLMAETDAAHPAVWDLRQRRAEGTAGAGPRVIGFRAAGAGRRAAAEHGDRGVRRGVGIARPVRRLHVMRRPWRRACDIIMAVLFTVTGELLTTYCPAADSERARRSEAPVGVGAAKPLAAFVPAAGIRHKTLDSRPAP